MTRAIRILLVVIGAIASSAVGIDSGARRGVVLSQRHKGTEMDENQTGTLIVDGAVHLHQALGPGLLESVYEVTRIIHGKL